MRRASVPAVLRLVVMGFQGYQDGRFVLTTLAGDSVAMTTHVSNDLY